jgi:hypothetical protein
MSVSRPVQGQYATLVSADTGGVFWRRGRDTLFVADKSWVGRDSAYALPACVYSGRSQRMLARDSVWVTIGRPAQFWTGSLRPGEERQVDSTWTLPSGRRFTLLDVSAPISPCGVNAGQVWFHWTIE